MLFLDFINQHPNHYIFLSVFEMFLRCSIVFDLFLQEVSNLGITVTVLRAEQLIVSGTMIELGNHWVVVLLFVDDNSWIVLRIVPKSISAGSQLSQEL